MIALFVLRSQIVWIIPGYTILQSIAWFTTRVGSSKKYLKEFSSVTTTANDGYPIYRHVNNDHNIEVGGCLLTIVG